MKVAPIPRLAVPAGTAAAAVIARAATPEPALESRRFGAIACLPDPAFRGAFEELVTSGVYTVLAERIVVLRVSHAGVRSHAAIVRITGAHALATGRAGLVSEPVVIGCGDIGCGDIGCGDGGCGPAGSTTAYRTLLEAETKQRPVFHATTAEGITYSGFAATAQEEIRAAVEALLPADAPPAELALVFSESAVEVPAGIAVVLGPALA